MVQAERYKGHDVLLELWPEVLKRTGGRLCIVGDGDDRERLERKAAKLRRGESVTFLGAANDALLAAAYRDCAFFLMPSAGEGFGLVYAEAMAAGKPCIAGNGAAREIVQHGVDGFVVDPADRAELFGAVVRLFSEPDLRATMGERAKVHAQRFTEAAFAERIRAALGIEQAVSACAG